MKPITGAVVSSRPVSLPKAALVLSNFLSTDNGATEEMLAYLNRSSAAFDELVDFHRQMKLRRERTGYESGGEERTEKRRKKNNGRENDAVEAVEDGNEVKMEVNGHEEEGLLHHGKDKKKKKRKEKGEGLVANKEELDVSEGQNGVVQNVSAGIKDEPSDAEMDPQRSRSDEHQKKKKKKKKDRAEASEMTERGEHEEQRKDVMEGGGGHGEHDAKHKKKKNKRKDREEFVEDETIGDVKAEQNEQPEKKKKRKKVAEEEVEVEGGSQEKRHKKKMKIKEEQ